MSLLSLTNLSGRDSLRIAVDARWLTKSSGGIITYLLNLLAYLPRIDEGNTYFILYNKEQSREEMAEITSSPNNFSFLPCCAEPYSFREQLELPSILRKHRCDILHSPHFMVPLYPLPTKLIITIHDLIPLKFRRFLPISSKVRRLFGIYRFLLARSAHHADHIITDSQNSAGDIISMLRINPQRISIIPPGVSPTFQPEHNARKIKATRQKWGISKPYLLFVGRQDYNKNLRIVVEAFLTLRRLGYDLMLVLITEEGEYYHQVEGYIQEDGAEKDVLLTGCITLEDLVSLYNGALCLLMPSLYEGFGLPALEAMACGTPAIISRAASLPEVAGDAGIYVAPHRDDQIVSAVEKLINDADWRKRISQAGIQRSAQFSWEETAMKTLQVYQQVVGR